MITQKLPEIDTILYDDLYGLRKFLSTGLDTIIDIGANRGTFLLCARILFPKARLIAYEPSNACVVELRELASLLGERDIVIHQAALGNGEFFQLTEICLKNQDPYSLRNVYNQVDRILSFENLDRKLNTSDIIKSYLLREILKRDNVDLDRENVYLKIDCEGGERYLVNDQSAATILQKFQGIGLEVHFSAANDSFWDLVGFPKLSYYENWIAQTFCEKCVRRGRFRKNRGFGIFLIYPKNPILAM